MGVDYSCLFPTGMLNIGLHPQTEMEVDLCWAYNRWLTEKVMPEAGGRFFSLLCLPFSDPDAALRQVETFGGRKHVGGFMITTVRSNMGVHDNAYMKVYRAMEERGLAIAFHSGVNWSDTAFKSCNRFISVHALGFTFYNIVNCTNWVINGIGERFPKLPVIWMESGLAWVPFLMQRLDHEYMLRPSEAPLLKKKPSDYMREMFYSSQPMEIQDYDAMETTFRMINAETQLLYSSDYPHWDFDLPSTIWDLPFLSEKAKHNILGGTAARLFKLAPRNEKQKEKSEEVRQSGRGVRAELPAIRASAKRRGQREVKRKQETGDSRQHHQRTALVDRLRDHRVRNQGKDRAARNGLAEDRGESIAAANEGFSRGGCDNSGDNHRRPQAEDDARPIANLAQHRGARGSFGDATEKHSEHERERQRFKTAELRPDHQASRNGIEDVAEHDRHAGAFAGLGQQCGGFASTQAIETGAGHLGPDLRIDAARAEVADRPRVSDALDGLG